jgi:hypothetical protein
MNKIFTPMKWNYLDWIIMVLFLGWCYISMLGIKLVFFK